MPIKTLPASLEIFFWIFLVVLFGNTEIFQPFRVYRQQMQLSSKTVQIGFPCSGLLGALRFCTVVTEGIKPIAWPRTSIADLRNELDLILWKPEVIFFLY